MVKRSRDQSTPSPSRRICPWIWPPDSAFHRQTRSTNASRPRSWREVPSAASCRSTAFCVAMPAWSMPGCHSVSKPCIRLRRVRASISVCSKACPMCRLPYTFGGGMTMAYGSFSLAASAVKYPRSTQRSYSLSSTSAGVYCVGRSAGALRGPLAGGWVFSVTSQVYEEPCPEFESVGPREAL